MLLDVNPPLETIDQFWIRQTEELIAVRVKSIQDTLAVESKKFAEVQKTIRDTGVGLKDIVTGHHKLMTDVALLLKTIQKIENFEFAALNNFLTKYKEYSEQLNTIIKIVLSEDISADAGRMIIERLDWVKEETNFIYEELINIAAVARDESLVQVISPVMICYVRTMMVPDDIMMIVLQEMFKSRMREEEQLNTDSSVRNKSDKSGSSGPRQVSEEKNKFALSVLRRVRVKLEGREPDSLRKVLVISVNRFIFNVFCPVKSSVGEQVDFIIREAMNMENLALMYEGWTAWI